MILGGRPEQTETLGMKKSEMPFAQISLLEFIWGLCTYGIQLEAAQEFSGETKMRACVYMRERMCDHDCAYCFGWDFHWESFCSHLGYRQFMKKDDLSDSDQGL